MSSQKHAGEEVRIEISFVLTPKGAHKLSIDDVLAEIRAHMYETYRGDEGPNLVTGVIANEVTG